MSVIERNMMEGEQVVFRGRLHWLLFLKPALLLAGAIAGFAAGKNENNQYLTYLGWGLLAAAVLTGIPALITRYTSEFLVTNKRVIAKVGFLHSHSLELLLAKVEAIIVDQNLLGRLLGFGTVGITGTGGTLERFDNIASPVEFRTRIQEQISAVQDTRGDARGAR